jgi:hypothetical protein
MARASWLGSTFAFNSRRDEFSPGNQQHPRVLYARSVFDPERNTKHCLTFHTYKNLVFLADICCFRQRAFF